MLSVTGNQRLITALVFLLIHSSPRSEPLLRMLVLTGDKGAAISTGSQSWNDFSFQSHERYLVPAEDDTVILNGTPYVWTREFNENGLWHTTASGPGVIYRSVCFYVEADQTIRIRYRHNAGIAIWAYGHPLVLTATGDGATASVSRTIRVPAGNVRLIFKSEVLPGNNYFSATILDSSGNDIPSPMQDFISRGGIDPGGMIRILSPAAGQTFSPGSVMTIRWVIDTLRLGAGVALYFSGNAGLDFIMIVDKVLQRTDQGIYTGDMGTFQWTIPDSVYDDRGNAWPTSSDSCLIRVYSQYDPNTPDEAVGPFTIGSTRVIRAPRVLMGVTGVQDRPGQFDLRGRRHRLLSDRYAAGMILLRSPGRLVRSVKATGPQE